MKTFFFATIIILTCLSAKTENSHYLAIAPAQEDCVFNFVKNSRASVTAIVQQAQKPVIVYSHQIDFTTYQRDFQAYQGFVPDYFLNYFNSILEKVYLYTSWDRYSGKRSPLDSLAHELTHFFQFIESGKDPDLQKNDPNDYLELEAVRIQTRFREQNICN